MEYSVIPENAGTTGCRVVAERTFPSLRFLGLGLDLERIQCSQSRLA